jgi:hypothetical protein
VHTVRCLHLPLAAALLVAIGATPVAAQGALPVDMQGTWAWDDEACAERVSDGRVAVSSLIVEFYASAFVLDDPKPADGGRWVSTATVHVEGESTTEAGSIALRLVGRDELEIRTGEEAPSIYVRCADDLPVR